MNITEIFKDFEKVHDFYYEIFGIEERKGKKTLLKMYERIVRFYSEPKNIVLMCSKEEVDFLCRQIEGKDDKESPNKYWLIKDYLDMKLLRDWKTGDIPDEFVKPIEQAAKLYKEKENIEYDNDLKALLGSMRVYACILKKNFIIYNKILLDVDERKMEEYNDSPRFQLFVSEYYNENMLEELAYKEFEYG